VPDGQSSRPRGLPAPGHHAAGSLIVSTSTFASNRDGQRAIYIQPANGGTAERLTLPEAGVDHRPEAWIPDGKTLAYLVNKIDGDIWTVAIDGDRKPKPLVERSGSNERYTAFSPSGRWFAYVSTEVGNRMEVFVQAFPPSSNARYQISTEGGVTPVWSPDGKQLFYGDTRTGRIIAVDINTGPPFSIGKPVALPIERAAIIGNYPGRNFDITPDGKQFIVVMPVASATDTSRRINVVVNWLEELKQRVPVK
jgi:WD40-like Beta Propeller Repeat